jgi:hypothetical protein
VTMRPGTISSASPGRVNGMALTCVPVTVSSLAASGGGPADAAAAASPCPPVGAVATDGAERAGARLARSAGSVRSAETRMVGSVVRLGWARGVGVSAAAGAAGEAAAAGGPAFEASAGAGAGSIFVLGARSCAKTKTRKTQTKSKTSANRRTANPFPAPAAGLKTGYPMPAANGSPVRHGSSPHCIQA